MENVDYKQVNFQASLVKVVERYSRQVLALGLETQEKLREISILVAGCGATGSHVLELLVRMGVREVLVVDPDIVELSNLHRTSLFKEEDVGSPKAKVCARRATEINSEVSIKPFVDMIDQSNVLKFVKTVDFVFDGLDSMYSRLILNDAAVQLGRPLVYGGVEGEYGTAYLIVPHRTACLSCFVEGEQGIGLAR